MSFLCVARCCARAVVQHDFFFLLGTHVHDSAWVVASARIPNRSVGARLSVRMIPSVRGFCAVMSGARCSCTLGGTSSVGIVWVSGVSPAMNRWLQVWGIAASSMLGNVVASVALMLRIQRVSCEFALMLMARMPLGARRGFSSVKNSFVVR